MPTPAASTARTPKSRKGKEKAIQEDQDQDEDAADAAAVEASVLPPRLVVKDVVTSPLVLKIPTEIVKKVSSIATPPTVSGDNSIPMSKSAWETRVRELKPLVEVTEDTVIEDGE